MVKFHASKFFQILLMMNISIINRSQHENRNFHVFDINIKVQSKEFVNPMVNPWLIRLPPTSAR